MAETLFRGEQSERLWQKYCGFLELSLAQFREIQEQLLLEEIQLVSNSPLGRSLLQGAVPTTATEFRSAVPLTTYDDYAQWLNEKREDVLVEKPFCWAYTQLRGGLDKWVPYSRRAYERLVDSAVAAIILAAASDRGEVNIKEGDRGVYNLAPSPYLSGLVSSGVTERFGFRPLPPLEVSQKMDFEQRIEAGFRMALRSGVDILFSLTSILVKMGERFAERQSNARFSLSMLHPCVLLRLARAWVTSRLEGRAMLPRDLWRLKAIVGWGIDTSFYSQQVARYWGREPYEFHACTEAGIIALQGWNKKAMTFLPYSAFLEFIPETEWLKSQKDRGYQPETILLDEVEEGKRYELVLTSFYGMPFLRYRVGHMVKIVSLKDEETGVALPQMVFVGRADETIDLAGFTRLDEKVLGQAIADSGIRHEDWVVRKEYEQDRPILRLYIELKDGLTSQQVESLVHQCLKAIDPTYRDLEDLLGLRPLRVTLLPRGTFQRYYEEMKGRGLDLTGRRPPRINAPDSVMEDLLRLSSPGPA